MHTSFTRFAVVFLLAVVLVPLFLAAFANITAMEPSLDEDFYLGITASGDVAHTKELIDETKNLVNLVVFTDIDVNMRKSNLVEIADYAYDAGLNFLVYMIWPSPFADFDYNPIEWMSEAKVKYGSQFLGYYLWDEPGGRQLDRGNFRQFDNDTMPHDYHDAANTYVYYLYIQMRDFIKTEKLFTSDYGLYWYNYEAGYDVVLSQFGWNHTRAIDIAQCRGAAEMHNKTWGAMITWTYDKPPYIASPDAIYEDMVLAYESGAKYVVVFNYPTNVTKYGVLTEAHLEAMANFRNFVLDNPQNQTSNTERVAYALPDNYGWGLRNPNDTIWGVWPADNESERIWSGLQSMRQQYGTRFDIVIYSPWTRLFWRQHYDRLVLEQQTIP